MYEKKINRWDPGWFRVNWFFSSSKFDKIVESSRARLNLYYREALENEDRSKKHPNLENEAPKTRKGSTQISKTKHPKNRKRSTQKLETGLSFQL